MKHPNPELLLKIIADIEAGRTDGYDCKQLV